MEGFTRTEAIALTKTTSSHLAYLDRAGFITPEKYGNSKKPTVIYSWKQVLEIWIIKDLAQKVSTQTVKKIIKKFDARGFEPTTTDKHIVFVNDEVFCLSADWSDMPCVMKVADKKREGLEPFVLLVLPPIANIIKAVWETAKKSKVVDFQSFQRRAKAHL